MADTEKEAEVVLSIADSDSAVAGASVAITVAEEDRSSKSSDEKNVSAPASVVDGNVSSIAATDLSVAGSSVTVTVTEVEEDIIYSSAQGSSVTGAGAEKTVILSKDSSVDLSICATSQQNIPDRDENNEEENAAPMHLHALSSPAKLKGVPRSRSSSRSRPSSRKNSPQPRVISNNLVGTTISPSSATSSLDGSSGMGEHVIDPDLLLDKLGLRDLDANASQEEIQEMLKKHISSNNGLPTLNERLSEETLDDTHAFQDLVITKKVGNADNSQGESLRQSLIRGASAKVMEVALDALTEEDEDDDGVDQSGGSER